MSDKAELEQLKKEIAHLSQKIAKMEDNLSDETWLDSADIKLRFHFSDSKLYRLRKANQIPHQKIGRTYYYPKSYFTKILMQKIKNKEERSF